MAKSSINFQRTSAGSSNHNLRFEKVNYLISDEKYNWNLRTKIEQKTLLKNLYENAQHNYKKSFGQKLQSKTYQWEAVVNLNKEHNPTDLKNLVEVLEKETGFQCLNISIHRDEGILRKGDKVLRPGTDIFYNKDDDKFYQDSEFKTAANTDGYKKQKNLHAHINFFTLDQKTGQQLYRKSLTKKQEKQHPELKPMNRKRLSDIQTLVADTLEMKRGKINSQTKRLSAKQFKRVAKDTDNLKNQIQTLETKLSHQPNIISSIENWISPKPESPQAKQKDLKEEMKKLREELQKNKAERKDYAKLEALNKKLIDKIKNKDLTILELKKELKTPKKGTSHTNENDKIKKIADLAAQEINKLKEALEEANYKIERQEKTIHAYKQELLSYRGSDRQIMRKELIDLQFENKKLKKEIELLKNKPMPNVRYSQEYRTLQMEYDKLYSSNLALQNQINNNQSHNISPSP
ncbi:MAG: hypothetical protein PHS42_08385 [Sulfurimonas sp.]|nr:hypothetical protein [Sulfurimonas sp.]MDD3835478.1 hypothetical protein [Sulfurimonas sp.]